MLLVWTLRAQARTFNFYQISFFPRGVITRVSSYLHSRQLLTTEKFESTVIIPPASSDLDVSPKSVRAFWPGLMPGPPGTVGGGFIQNIVTNQGGILENGIYYHSIVASRFPRPQLGII